MGSTNTIENSNSPRNYPTHAQRQEEKKIFNDPPSTFDFSENPEISENTQILKNPHNNNNHHIPENPQSSENSKNPQISESLENTESPKNLENSEKSEKSEKSENHQNSEKSEKSENPENNEKSEKSENPEIELETWAQGMVQILFIGPKNCGKTTLRTYFHQFSPDSSPSSLSSTLTVPPFRMYSGNNSGICRINFKCSESTQTAELTSGTLTARPDAIVFVYDLSKKKSTSYVSLYLCKETWNFTKNIYAVGNKLDLTSTLNTEATYEVQKFLDQIFFGNKNSKKFRGFFGTSGKTGQNVQSLFVKIAQDTCMTKIKQEFRDILVTYEKINIPSSFWWLQHRCLVLLWQLVVQGRATVKDREDPFGVFLMTLFEMPPDIVKSIICMVNK